MACRLWLAAVLKKNEPPSQINNSLQDRCPDEVDFCVVPFGFAIARSDLLDGRGVRISGFLTHKNFTWTLYQSRELAIALDTANTFELTGNVPKNLALHGEEVEVQGVPIDKRGITGICWARIQVGEVHLIGRQLYPFK